MATRELRRGRILVVDDDEAIRKIFVRILCLEHDVIAVSCMRDALETLRRKKRFDIIFCDLMLGDGTGMELHAEAERIDAEQAKRFFFVTGGACSPKEKAFLDSMPNRIIEKPFDPSDLRSLVQTVLGHRPPER